MKTKIQPELYREFEANSGYWTLFQKTDKIYEKETTDGGYRNTCARKHMGRKGGGTELCWPRHEVVQKLKELASNLCES